MNQLAAQRGVVQSLDLTNMVAAVQLPDGPVVNAAWLTMPPLLASTVWMLEVRSGSWLVLGPENAHGPRANNVDTTETSTSLTYTDLTTVGPAVTLLTGAAVIVTLTAQMANSGAGAGTIAAFAVSGASTIAANDNQSIANQTTVAQTASGSFNVTGLTPGLNTFTMKYRVGATTGTWLRRNIAVTPMGA